MYGSAVLCVKGVLVFPSYFIENKGIIVMSAVWIMQKRVRFAGFTDNAIGGLSSASLHSTVACMTPGRRMGG